MKDQAIFIVGCPRSGTTLLRETLNKHSEIAITPETHYFTHFRKQLVGRKLTRNKYIFYKRYLALIYRFMETPVINKIVNNFSTLNEVLLALNDYHLRNYYWFKNSDLSIKEIKDNHLPRSSLSPYQRVFKAWLKAFAHKRNRGIPGEKTPIHVLYMKEIQEIFKNAMFIHIVRDPYSTIASLKKMPWASNNVENNAKLWIKCTNVDTNGIKNYYRINFEDLISEPERVMGDVCGFLGIEFQKEMLEKVSKKNTLEKGEYWKKYATEEISFKKITSNEQELSEIELKTIKNILNDFKNREES